MGFEYHEVKRKKADRRQIRTIVYHTLKNSEAIGNTTMPYMMLVQRVEEHIEELQMLYNHKEVESIIDEMIMEDILYRVSTPTDFSIGLVI